MALNFQSENNEIERDPFEVFTLPFLSGMSEEERNVFVVNITREMSALGHPLYDPLSITATGALVLHKAHARYQHAETPITYDVFRNAIHTVLRKMGITAELPPFGVGVNTMFRSGEELGQVNDVLKTTMNLTLSFRENIAGLLQEEKARVTFQRYRSILIPSNERKPVQILVNGKKAMIQGSTGTLTINLGPNQELSITPQKFGEDFIAEISFMPGIEYFHNKEGTIIRKLPNASIETNIITLPKNIQGCRVTPEEAE